MIDITPAARERIQSFVDVEVVGDPALRIELDAAANSPLARQYSISLVEREDRKKTEIAINVDNIRVFLNLDTSNLLSGATVDWVDENGQSGFRVTDPNARPAAQASLAGDAATPSGPLAQRIQDVLEQEINPRIAAHGGAVELVDVDEGTLYLRMSGGCQGCAASAATLRQGVERMVREAVPEIHEIVDLTDHTAGTNPYF
ncbi:MAG: NifU family protein [Gemmatimonadetes bacterium]|nr:NifU family protein [Gemmatimonadota bacterium]